MANHHDIQDPPLAEVTAEVLAEVKPPGDLDLGYQVAIDQFSGPLDLLLYLVKRTEVDIVDIPLATITDQFVATLAAWQSLDLDVAGDFIVMAAALLEFKARQLVPPPERAEGDTGEGDDFEDVLDPRADLIQRLLQYRRFKDAAVLLDEHEALRSHMAVRQMREAIPEDVANEPEIELTDLDVHQLYRSFELQMARISGLGPRRVVLDEIPIDVRIQRLIDTLQAHKHASLSRLLGEERSRGSQAGVLVASLEIVRQRFAEVSQLEQYGEADLRWREIEERGIATELPPEEAEPPGRRRRRPPLVTFAAPVAEAPTEASEAAEAAEDAAEQAAAEAEGRVETDEQRFLRELDESCNLSAVLATAADVESAFIATWQATHDGELPPTIAVERAAEYAAKEEAQRQAAAKEAERVAREAERAARAAARAEQRSAQWAERKDQILAARAKREAESGVTEDQVAAEQPTTPAADTPPVAPAAEADQHVDGESVAPVSAVEQTDTPPAPDGSQAPSEMAAPTSPDALLVPGAEPPAEGTADIIPVDQPEHPTAVTEIAEVVPLTTDPAPIEPERATAVTEIAEVELTTHAPASVDTSDRPTAVTEIAEPEPVPADPDPVAPTVVTSLAVEVPAEVPVEKEAAEASAAPTLDEDELSPAAAAILAAAEELFAEAAADQADEDADDAAAATMATVADDADDLEAVNAALLADSAAVEDDDDEDTLFSADVAEHELLHANADEEDDDDQHAQLAGDPGLHPPTQAISRARDDIDPDHLRLLHSGAADDSEADDAAIAPDASEPAVAMAGLTTGMAAVIEAPTDDHLIIGPPEAPLLTGAAADTSFDSDAAAAALAADPIPGTDASDPEDVWDDHSSSRAEQPPTSDASEPDPEFLLGAAGVAPDDEPEPAEPTPRETAVYRSLVNTDAAATDDDSEDEEAAEAPAAVSHNDAEIPAVAADVALDTPAADAADAADAAASAVIPQNDAPIIATSESTDTLPVPESEVPTAPAAPPPDPEPLRQVEPPAPPPPPLARPPQPSPRPPLSFATATPSTATTSTPIAAPAPMRPSHRRFWLAVAALALINVLGWVVYSYAVWVPRHLLEVSAPATIVGDTPWEFRFNLDVVPFDQIGTTPEVVPTVVPDIRGRWQWRDPRTLTFVPAVEVPPGFTVLVTMPSTAVQTPHRLRLGQDLSCSLRTAPLVAQEARVLAFAEDGRHTVEVVFDGAIEPERLRDRISVIDDDGITHPAHVVSAAKGATMRVEVGGKDVVPAPGPAHVALSPAEPGPLALSSPQRLDGGWRGAVRLGHRLHVLAAKPAAPARGAPTIALTLDTPDVDRSLLRDSLSVEPEVAYTIDDTDTGVILRGAFVPGNTYQVRITARHPTQIDGDMPLTAHPAASHHVVTIPDRAPGLWLAGDVERLVLTGVNCGTVVVTVLDDDANEIARHLLALDVGEPNAERSRELALAELLPHLPAGSFRLVAEAAGQQAVTTIAVRDVAISDDRWAAATGPWLIRRIAGDRSAQPRLRLASVAH